MRLIQIFEAKSYILKPFTLLDMELSHRVHPVRYGIISQGKW